MQYLFGVSVENADGTVTIPAVHVARWKRQMTTAYDNLSEREKDSDREEADKILALIGIFDGE